MKKIILFLFCDISILINSQDYSLKKPSELQFLDPVIKQPKEFYFTEKTEYFNTKGFKIKSKQTRDRLTEYDIKGNIVTEKDNLYDKKISYNYKNKILVEKKITSVANRENIRREEDQEDREISRQISNGANTVAKSNYLSYNTESLEITDLDKNNNIAAFSYRDYKTDNAGKKKLLSDNSFAISYNNSKISEISSKNETEKFVYDKDLLVKKEYSKKATNYLLAQDVKKIFSYHYDKKKNLIAVWHDETVSRNGKVDAHSFYRIDSAKYDDKNRIIWKGSNDNFTTYKYDSKNNVAETSIVRNSKMFLKNEHIYNSQNKIGKSSIVFFKDGKEENRLVIAFIYDKDLLREILQGNNRKTVLDYDAERNLLKQSEYSKPYQEKDKPPVEFRLESETNYIWGDKFLSVENKYSTTKYSFY